MTNKEQKNNKEKSKKKGYVPPVSNNPKPFEQFSNPKKFFGGPQTSFNAFHRRLNTRRSSGS